MTHLPHGDPPRPSAPASGSPVREVPDSQHPGGWERRPEAAGRGSETRAAAGQTGPGPSHRRAARPGGGWWAESPPGSKLGIWKSPLRRSHEGSEFRSRAPGFRQNHAAVQLGACWV